MLSLHACHGSGTSETDYHHIIAFGLGWGIDDYFMFLFIACYGTDTRERGLIPPYIANGSSAFYYDIGGKFDQIFTGTSRYMHALWG